MVLHSKNSPKPKQVRLEDAVAFIKSLDELFDEPMYNIDETNVEKIAILLDIPFVSFGGIEKYTSIAEKAAALFYHAVKDHYFPNGNKRTATALTLLFLRANNKWLDLNDEEIYSFSMRVASSQLPSDQLLSEILSYLSKHIIKWKPVD